MKDKVLQDLHQVPPTVSSEKELDRFPWFRWFRKIFLLLVGIMAIVLMLSYVLVTFPVADILVGKMDSTLIQDHKLTADGITIIFADQVQQQLQQAFLKNQKTEFSVCLQGMVREGVVEKVVVEEESNNIVENDAGDYTVQGKEYLITSLYFPQTYRQLFNQVVFAACSPETLIILHSHPYKRCSASRTDINTLRKTQRVNPQALMLVLCEPGRVAVYS